MLYALSYLLMLPALVAVLLLPGLAATRWLGGRGSSRPRLVDSAVLGIGLWAALLFCLAVSGGYAAWALRLAALLVVALSGALLLVRGPSPPIGTLGAWRRHRGALLPILGLAAALALLFLHGLDPSIAWDADVYHLALPKLYLEAGGFQTVPFNVYSHWPSNAQLLYGLALALRDHVLATLLHFLFGVLTLAALFAICREAGRPGAAWLAAPLLLANGVVLFAMRVAYTDLAVAFLFVAAVLYTLRASRDPVGSPVDLAMAGIATGLLAGVKLTAWLALPCLVALYLTAGGPLARSARGLRRLLLWALAPAALIAAPWLIRSALTAGNPVYPFLHSWLGGVEWSDPLASHFYAWQRSIGMGREAVDYLLLPARVILDGGRGYERFDGEINALWIVLLPLACLGSFYCAWVRRCLGVTGLYFALWALGSQQMRFLIPALPLLAVAVALTVDRLVDRLPLPRWRGLAKQGAVVAALALLAFEARVQLPPTAPLARGLWEHGFRAQELAVPPVARAVNEHTPEDARILLVNFNRRFHFHREVLADSFFEASQIAHVLLAGAETPDEVMARLRRRGVTHILLHRPGWSVPLPEAFFELLGDQQWARLLSASPDGRFLLFELLAAAPPGGDRP